MVILIAMTFALVYCYKKKWYRLMDGFLAISTFLIAGLIFYYYLVELLWATNTVMSWPTLVFIIHQFCWGGMFSIHWKAPLRVRQFYLVAVSVSALARAHTHTHTRARTHAHTHTHTHTHKRVHMHTSSVRVLETAVMILHTPIV
jgi:hypothetical protein